MHVVSFAKGEGVKRVYTGNHVGSGCAPSYEDLPQNGQVMSPPRFSTLDVSKVDLIRIFLPPGV